jgi:hypothetical protein
MTSSSFEELRRHDAEPKFDYIDPPFNFNSSEVREYASEVSGHYLLKIMCLRLGWPSLAGKRLLDYGCGVRFARTIINLGMDIGFYAGVDVNNAAIAWLQANVADERFSFTPTDVSNQRYNPEGTRAADKNLLTDLGLSGFDAACMFSVITHQKPDEAELTFAALRESVVIGGALYFTAFIDSTDLNYHEAAPNKPGHRSIYHPDVLINLVERCGWRVHATYARSKFQQAAFLCR